MNVLKKMLTVLMILLFASQVEAELQPVSADKRIQFFIAPYAWFIGMKGTAGAGGRTTELDFSFSDVRDHVDFAGMLAVEVVFDNTFGLTANLNLAELGDQRAHNGVSLSGASSLLISDIAAFYRVVSTPFGKNDSSLMNLDLLAGIRIWDVGLELNLDTPYLGSHRLSRSRDWVDPFFGLRAQFHMDDKWSVILQGGVGGGGDTSSTWDASVRVAWKIGGNSTLLLGYRVVDVNRREGSGTESFVFDTKISGPLIGLIFTF